MQTLETTSQQGTKAVHRLRERKLRHGLPFMINSKELAANQCYLEYPDGSIKLVTIIHATQEVNVVRELTTAEARKLRIRFHFEQLQ